MSVRLKAYNSTTVNPNNPTIVKPHNPHNRKTPQPLMMKRYLFILSLIAMAFAACSSDDGASAPSGGEPLETVQLYVSVPGAQATRVGDPGQAVPEGVDWDELAVMIEYTGNSLPARRRIVKTISKTDFDHLPSLDADGKVKIITLDVEPGDVYIYGVTYTSEEDLSPKTAIEGWENNGVAVEELAISNNYADGNIARLLSVATGYYDLKDGKHTGGKQIFHISRPADGDFNRLVPTVALTRLAAKIDIQWDAEDAYTQGYTDVEVTGFTYGSGTDIAGEGYGRLFPDLYSGSVAKGGSKAFYNDSPISRRNGRVYHYVFPDGVSKPKITFNISAENTDGALSQEKQYTFTFTDKLKKATWYKINTTIKGVTGNADIEVSPDGSPETTIAN